MDTLSDLLHKRKWGDILQLCEEEEILNPECTSCEIYALMICSYMVENQLEHVRFLWTRLPKQFQEYTSLQQLFQAYQALKAREMQLFRQTMENATWPDTQLQLIQITSQCIFESHLANIAKVYSSLELNHLAEVLGVTPERTKSIINSTGWILSASGNYVTPVPPGVDTAKITKGMEIVEKLSSYVSQLEDF